MREDQAKLFDKIDNLEPGGFGEQIISGAVGLALLLEQILNPPSGPNAALEQKVEALSKQLDETNELLHNMIKVLSSTS